MSDLSLQSSSLNKAEISNTSEAPVVSGAMDPALKEKWVEALRSGAFTQHVGGIGRDDNLCCLGVGARVAGVKEVGFGTGILSRECTVILGLSFDVGVQLAKLNDHGRGFPEIADYIETNIPTTDNSVSEDRS